jgi:hypothetical protein
MRDFTAGFCSWHQHDINASCVCCRYYLFNVADMKLLDYET